MTVSSTASQDVADEHHWHILRLAIQPDHAHLFIRANP
jgi:REP element-mobilizing transposase RayT